MHAIPDWAVTRAHHLDTLRALGLTRRELDSPLWESPLWGVRRWGPAESDDVRAVITAAAARLPDGCALGGWAAAYVHGIRCLDGNVGLPHERPVPLIAPRGHQLRKRAGLRPVRTLVPPEDIEMVDGLPVVVLDLAGMQEMCMAPNLAEALVVADMATSVRTGDPSVPLFRLARRIGSTKKTRGIVQTREALGLADARSASPEESRTRLLWLRDAGLPRPRVNPPIFDLDGHLLGFGDLVDPQAGHVHEIDGAHHRGLAQHTDDNRREERLEAHGLVVTRSTSRDRADRFGLAARMRDANRRGLARDRTQDRWTLTPPPGWVEPRPHAR